jgi:phage baseplate assembly protein W
MEFEIAGVTGDVYQSLNTLFSTPVGTLVFDREYGISWDGVDSPPEIAVTMLAAEIMEKTERYEPRAIVRDIISEAGADGIVKVRVVVQNANQESAAG